MLRVIKVALMLPIIYGRKFTVTTPATAGIVMIDFVKELHIICKIQAVKEVTDLRDLKAHS